MSKEQPNRPRKAEKLAPRPAGARRPQPGPGPSGARRTDEAREGPRPSTARPARSPVPERSAEIRESDRLWMALDPASREALRLGEGPAAGPVFFTSPEAMRSYAQRAGLTGHEPYEVPAAVLTRMKGKPFYLDGEPGSVAEAARRLRARENG